MKRLKASADCTARNGSSRGRRAAKAASTARSDTGPTGADSVRSHQPAEGDSHPPPPATNTGPITLTRVVRLEIADFSPRSAREELDRLSRRLQQAANALVWHWLDWHRRAGTPQRLAALAAWYRSGKPQGAKPAAIGPACPPEVQRAWYYLLRDDFGDVQQRPRDLLLNWLARTFSAQESPKSRWKRWQCVLLGEERPAAFLSPQPIRLDGANTRMAREGPQIFFTARLSRSVADGTSEQLRLALLPPRANDSRSTAEYRGQWQMAAEVADGRRKLLGSQLVPDGGKWFLMLTVQTAAEPAEVAAQNAAVLRPGKRDPWRLRARVGGRHVTGGFGRIRHRGERLSLLDAVGALREKIVLARARQQGIADHLPHAVEFFGLRDRWNRACTNLNRETAARLAETILAERIGRLTLIAGSGASLLETAGKQDDLPDPTAFPFHQLFRFLREKLEPRGVRVVVRASLRSAKRRQEQRRK